jgi:hypothetical protein
MKLAKTIASGAAIFGLAVGTAFAGEGQSAMNSEETFILLEPMEVVQIYEVDEDRDGVTDSYLILEESDSLAMSEGEDFEPPTGG